MLGLRLALAYYGKCFVFVLGFWLNKSFAAVNTAKVASKLTIAAVNYG